MYDFTQDFTDYQKLVPNAELTVKTPSTVNTQPQGYDFTQDLESYRKIAPDMSGLESVNDPLIKKAQLAQEKQTEEDKKKLQLAADLMIQSGYSPDPEGVASAQITEGARKSLAGMQDRILGKSGVITQRFGNKNPIEKFSGGVNYGTDIGVPKGTKVSVPPGKWKVVEAYAGAEEGKSATNRGYGNSILVQNQETGEKMRFSHLQDVGVRPNEIIDGNKIVGTVGLTGNTTGPHLDLEMYDRSGKLIDILNTPYSSYLGLGQGGGSGKGGGNPIFDNMLKVGRQALESGVPMMQVPQRAKEALANANDFTNTMDQVRKTRNVTPEQVDKLMPVMGMTMPVTSIHKDDLRTMSDFIDFARGVNKVSGGDELAGIRIAEKYGLPMPKTKAGLANVFEKVLQQAAKIQNDLLEKGLDTNLLKKYLSNKRTK